jgi:hypothetical protein
LKANIKGHLFLKMKRVATLLWVKREDETPTPKVEDLESFGTPECLKFNSRGDALPSHGVRPS